MVARTLVSESMAQERHLTVKRTTETILAARMVAARKERSRPPSPKQLVDSLT